MSQYKFQLNLFSLTDTEGMRQRLEAMAEKGWQPVRIGPYMWRYQRTEPKKMRYHIAYFSKDASYDPEGAPLQRSYMQACLDAGWRYVSGYDCLQVFCTEESESTVPDVDPVMSLEGISSCFKKRERFLWLYMIAVALLILVPAVTTYLRDPIELLSNGAWQLALLSVLILVALVIFEAIRYGLWHRKATQQVYTQGSYSPLKSMLPLEIAVVAVALGILGFRLWIQDSYSRLVSIANIISYGVIFAAAAITRRIKRREGTERKSAVVMTITVVLLVALAMGMVQDVLLKNFRTQPTQSDMLLSLSDLTGERSETAYYSQEIQKSLLLEDVTQYQSTELQAADATVMQYRITKVKAPKLMGMCRENCLPERLHGQTDKVDAASWGAQQAWIAQYSGGRDVYYLYYEDRTVTLMVSWELTAEQIARLATMFQSV